MAINPRQLRTNLAPFVNIVYTLQALVQWDELYYVATLAMDDILSNNSRQVNLVIFRGSCHSYGKLWSNPSNSACQLIDGLTILFFRCFQRIMGVTSKIVPSNNTYIRELVMKFYAAGIYLSRTSALPCGWVD